MKWHARPCQKKSCQRSNRFKIEALKQELGNILDHEGVLSETSLLDDRSDSCKVFVVAKQKLYLAGPAVLLKSYELDSAEPPCTILEAALATTVTPTHFPQVEIDGNEYVDGGLSYYNPPANTLRDACRIWPSREIGCLVALRTGLTEPISGASVDQVESGKLLGFEVGRSIPLRAARSTVAE